MRPSSVLPLILVINTGVYLAWWILGPESQLMTQHFLVSWEALASGRIWTVATSAFSHFLFLHLFLNMYVLLGFGSILESILGPMRFLRFYLWAGVLGSVGHALASRFILERPDLPALGASGAVAGVVVVFSLVFPKQKLLLFGLIPLPALVAVALIVGIDLWGLASQAQGGGLPIGHGAHLGGSVTGFVYYWYFVRPELVRMRRWYQNRGMT